MAQQVLKGGVEEENLRLNPAGKRHPGVPLRGGANDSLRIQRAPMQGSAVDSTAFAAPLSPSNAPLSAGVVDTNAFAQPPKNFDIGAERGSKEMTLAWEKWHHQLSQAIYERWQRVAQDPGKATIKVTVTRDHHIVAQVISCQAGEGFEQEILMAIQSLDRNPGLTFPSESQKRQQVSSSRPTTSPPPTSVRASTGLRTTTRRSKRTTSAFSRPGTYEHSAHEHVWA